MSDATEPEGDFARMDRACQEVWRAVLGHRALAPIRETGERIYVQCHTESVWVGVRPDPHDANRYVFTARIDSPTWWDHEATGETFEGKAARVVERLARELRRLWEGRAEFATTYRKGRA